jgi:predicted nucleotidyltransferase
MKTHADIINILQKQENYLKTEFSIREIGLVSPSVEYKPVSNVRFFVEGVETSKLVQLKAYLETELGILVELVAKAAANGSFRYAFTDCKRKHE